MTAINQSFWLKTAIYIENNKNLMDSSTSFSEYRFIAVVKNLSRKTHVHWEILYANTANSRSQD